METSAYVWAFDLGKGSTGDSPVVAGGPPDTWLPPAFQPRMKTDGHGIDHRKKTQNAQRTSSSPPRPGGGPKARAQQLFPDAMN